MGACVHFSRSLPSNSWWQTMVGWQVLSRPSAAEGGGRRPAFTRLATQPYSATEADGWQHELSRVSQNRAAVHLAQSRNGRWRFPAGSYGTAHREGRQGLFCAGIPDPSDIVAGKVDLARNVLREVREETGRKRSFDCTDLHGLIF